MPLHTTILMFLALATIFGLHNVTIANDVGPVTCEIAPVGLAIVKGSIDDSELLFLVDSGASHNVISETALTTIDHAVPWEVKGYGNLKMIDAPTIRVQHLRDSRTAPMLVMDLTKLSVTCGIKVDGILGLPFLCNKSIEFKNGKLLIAGTPAVRRDTEVSILCSFDRFGGLNVPLNAFDSSLEDLGEALVDTGMNMPLSLSQETYSNLLHTGAINAENSKQQRLLIHADRFDTVDVCTGRISLTLRNGCSQRIAVHVWDENKVGLPFLLQCGSRIDFASGQLLLEQRPIAIGSKPENNSFR